MCFSALLEHHPDDEEIVKVCGKCLLQVLKLLPYDRVAVGMLNYDIAARAVEVIEFKDTTEANKELYIEILTRLCYKVPELDKFYTQGVAKLVTQKIKELNSGDWESQSEAARKISEGYIKLAAAIAANTLSADKIIESDIGEAVLSLFDNKKLPVSMLENTVEAMVAMSSDANCSKASP